ncbi:MAG: LysR family transcriptional regulator [Burkholderiaceae bacterium]
MYRNLDLSTLRSFVAVVDTGGMTSAANKLHLTQSAISMQIKRLEEMLGVRLLNRGNRKVRPSVEGEQLLAYARRMLQLNDEAWGQLTGPQFEGTVCLGVPGDIVHPHTPTVLRLFSNACPRARIKLTTGLTVELMRGLQQGQHDLVLTTLPDPPANGELLATAPLVWIGAVNGRAHFNSPLPIGFTQGCSFRAPAIAALDKAGFTWVDTVDTTDLDSAIVSVAADMAVTVEMDTFTHVALEKIDSPEQLPQLPLSHVAMFGAENNNNELVTLLANLLRQEFGNKPVSGKPAVVT